MKKLTATLVCVLVVSAAVAAAACSVQFTGVWGALHAQAAQQPTAEARAFGGVPLSGEPAFAYETIISGYWLAHGSQMVVDDQGSAYVIGSWYQDHQHLDILIFKLDPEGNLVWKLPIVGDEGGHDLAEDIALDSKGDVWVTGWTESEGFPTTPDALDDTLTGFVDAFVMKLDSDDGTILYSTLLGGDYTDEGRSIALDDEDNIYLVGTTGSTDFPTTEDAYQREPSAPLYIYNDAFITKLSPAGNEILYSTYFGGYKDDWAYDVALDHDGNMVFAGKTNADDFPLVNPIQSDPDTIFISKLSADGSTLLFSTYLGGEDLDTLVGMCLDKDDFVYITGSTRSVTFPTTPGAYQEDFVGEILGCEVPFGERYNCDDVFVTKLATDGSGLIYSTFLGGSITDVGRDIAVDSAGCAHVVGYTVSPDFPGSDEPEGGIFLSKLNQDASDLLYTLIKPSGSANAGHGIAIDRADDVYLTGAIHVPADIYVAKLTSAQVALPESYQIIRGRLLSGGLDDLFESDDSRLSVRAGIILDTSEPPVWLELEGTSPTASPEALRFTLEARAVTSGLAQKIELYNYVTQSYEEVDARQATTQDSVVTVMVTGNPSRFVDPDTLAMKAQLTWKPSGPILVWPFDVGIDQAVWGVTP